MTNPKMKLASLPIIFLFAAALNFYSCGSSAYDIEDVKNPPDTARTVPKPEIREETAQPEPEVKEKISTVETKIDVIYTIQLGAYTLESNALEILSRARNLFSEDVYYKLLGGLYKVRLGSFTTLPEAFTFLNKVKDAGFSDSFVTETDK